MMSHWSVKALCVCTPEVEPCQRSETDGPTSSNHSDSPSRSSFSSLLASLLSRRSCFSISELIRLASFASSLRQQAIMESKVITAWAEKPVGQGGGEAGYTSRKAANKWSWAEGFNKLPRRGQPQSHALVSFQKPGDPRRRCCQVSNTWQLSQRLAQKSSGYGDWRLFSEDLPCNMSANISGDSRQCKHAFY